MSSYSRDSILKELIQNAEDAKSTCFDYGWVSGIKEAGHPLLKTPSIFILDNGNFNYENAKAIQYILGGSSKPKEENSIGKFGLGLKSVFHICEAFFYISNQKEYQDEYNENIRGFGFLILGEMITIRISTILIGKI